MIYFTPDMTPAEAKRQHRALVRQHHPDLGGDLGTMQTINAQYDEFVKYGRVLSFSQPQGTPGGRSYSQQARDYRQNARRASEQGQPRRERYYQTRMF
jgi:curved DNA-binding protein CbpA